MKIGILYICTGKYTVFWKDFYLSCEKNFIKSAEKKYFVFTDAQTVDFQNENENINIIKQDNLGWPYNTLMRYDIFNRSKNQFKDCDFVFFFNANLIFNQEINQNEFLPTGDLNLTACIHPGYFNKNSKKFTYDKNPKSEAYLNDGKYYVAGGINGGKIKNFINTVEIINKKIQKDLSNNIIAIWHDESHWNKYVNEHLNEIKIISPAYLYPEGWDIPFEKKIIIRDKTKYGGHDMLRGNRGNKKLKTMIIEKIKRVINKIK